MPKDWFNLTKLTHLESIPPSGKIHFIGICGVGMGQLAVALAKTGYQISGSDQDFYEPIGSLLRSTNLKLNTGYLAENVPTDADLIVIGNAISYGNPEVDVIENLNLPYTCFPTLIYDSVIKNKHSIVVAGTHGKTTTTAMITSCLLANKSDPSFFVGGVASGLRDSLYFGNGSFSVVEGDEYDDVFFSKRAKFFHYQANTAIINAIEFDHADLYADLTAVKTAFNDLVLSLTNNDRLICCLDFKEIAELLPSWQKEAQCNIITFGENSRADVRITKRHANGLTQSFNLESQLFPTTQITLQVPGAFNARNATAAYCAGFFNGLPGPLLVTTLGQFQPVKRRQEIRFQNSTCILIEDFAHHPTAVKETITAIKDAFPQRTVWAVFEPRSNTSRRAIFKQDYLAAFDLADQAILSAVTTRATDKNQELLDVAELAQEISQRGTPCLALPNAASIADFLMKNATNNSVILLMSNGSFDGLPQLLTDRLTLM